MASLRSELLKTGLWLKSSLPSDNEYKILWHLAESRVARLIVRGDQRWGYIAGVTNNEQGLGFQSDGSDLVTMLTDWHNTEHYRPWVTPDPEYAAKHNFTLERLGEEVMAYTINEKGLEALAQYEAWQGYEIRRIELAKQLLEESRRHVQERTGARKK